MNRLEPLEPAPPKRREGAAYEGNGNGRGSGRHRDPDHGGGDDPSSDVPVKYLEIGSSGRRKYLVGLVAYLLFFAVVAVAVGWIFAYFTSSKILAAGLVGFMVTYMAIMGWLASRNIEKSDQGPDQRWH
jgi:hypothetical protein